MKIQQAIQILEDLTTSSPQFDPEYRHQAVHLAIILLRYIQNHALNLRDFLAFLSALEK